MIDDSSDVARFIPLPKVLLHDHLDGGLRPQTIIDLATEVGYEALPSQDAAELARWFVEACDSGSLVRYLETFTHTVAVMQTREALVRVAAECAEDLADDGVVYAEVRYAPELLVEGGLSLTEVVEAVQEGFALGSERAAARGAQIRMGTLLTAMRHAARSREIAELTVAYRDRGVVGFDIAGAEAGFPPTRHLDAFEYLQRENAHFTIHAGEAFGLPSIWEAIQWCGADRLGHGVRIIDDVTVAPDGTATLGRLAAYVRDKRIPLEMCPSSNIQTGAAASIAEHPIGPLARLRFRVTINTDNRLMSGTSMSREFALLADAFGYDLDDFRWFTVNAMKSAFIPFEERLALINDVIKPRYAALPPAEGDETYATRRCRRTQRHPQRGLGAEEGEDGEDPAVGGWVLVQAQLGEDLLGVSFHCSLGDEQLCRDATVGHALGYEGQHFSLARAEGAQWVVNPGPVHQLGNDRRVDDALVLSDPADRIHEYGSVVHPFLEQVAHTLGVVLQQPHGVAGFHVLGEYEHADRRVVFFDPLGRHQAFVGVGGRHPDVHDG